MPIVGWGLLVLATASGSVLAQVTPGAQVLGPSWQGQAVDVQGTVIAENGSCRQIGVDRDGLSGVGGRLWGCWTDPARAPSLGQVTRIHGVVATTRLTRMGPAWRVVPEVPGL